MLRRYIITEARWVLPLSRQDKTPLSYYCRISGFNHAPTIGTYRTSIHNTWGSEVGSLFDWLFMRFGKASLCCGCVLRMVVEKRKYDRRKYGFFCWWGGVVGRSYVSAMIRCVLQRGFWRIGLVRCTDRMDRKKKCGRVRRWRCVVLA